MWSRHRPDVSLGDIVFGVRSLLGGGASPDEAIVRGWLPPEEAVVCLSVRSGFDLLLQAMRLRPGDEILFSEVTIGGMVRVAEAAGATLRSAPVDRATLAPSPEAVAARVSPRTRAIVIAPLFGARCPMGPFAEIARECGALLIEDAAQAFAGRVFPGSAEADATLFSFGMIKRASAGGGAVLRVHDRALRAAMLSRLAAYPRQSRLAYARRLATLALLRVTSHHRLYGAAYRLLGQLGNPDQLVSGMGKTSKKQQSLDRLRRRPCSALTRLLERRVQQHGAFPSMVSRQTLAALSGVACGSGASTPLSWVLPVMVDDPHRAAERLRALGYDSSTLSSLVRIDNGKTACLARDGPRRPHWLDQTLFLPTDDAMPAAERERMLRVVLAKSSMPDKHAGRG